MNRTQQIKVRKQASMRKRSFQRESLPVFDSIAGLISGTKKVFFDLRNIGKNKTPA